MKINDIIDVHDEIIMSENKNTIMSALNKIKSYDWKKARDTFKNNFILLSKTVQKSGLEQEVLDIINKHLGTHYRSMDSIIHKKVSESRVNEGFGDWWKEATGNLYGALSFYPLLTMFLELDKVIKGTDTANIKAVIIYGLIWVAIISGKVILGSFKKDTGETKPNHVKASLHPSQTR